MNSLPIYPVKGKHIQSNIFCLIYFHNDIENGGHVLGNTNQYHTTLKHIYTKAPH